MYLSALGAVMPHYKSPPNSEGHRSKHLHSGYTGWLWFGCSRIGSVSGCDLGGLGARLWAVLRSAPHVHVFVLVR